MLRRPGEPGYGFRGAPGGRVEMIELVDDGPGERILYAADATVMECFVFTVVGDDVRDDLDLPYLEFPSGPADIAPHYHLGEGVNGSRTLFRRDSPVAATPGDHANLSALVPLSHCLGYSLDELKQSFLHQGGAPLLRGGRYAPRK
ncbi:TNT antitoxin family protein (plasmid) [Mycolicibacterium crocinum]|uniref:TNT antitoxin family protein n=1 Tax=Mycolicibacterium crocinum TaxID=388459 RepID=A0ABY3TWN9_9MYCO|nr:MULTISPECIES: TNT antitoxin family protein [Mycolicibacterium]ULN44767.2 TNT antitoxin family protein [Mycolicibacterium crocinum]